MAGALTLTIGGVDRSSMLQKGSLQIADEAQNRSTCRFVIVDTAGVYRPTTGVEVTIVDADGNTVFGGSIEKPRRSKRTKGGALSTDVTCVDYNAIADRHIVARSYVGQAAGEIVRDIVQNDLAGEGISVIGSTISVTGSQIGDVLSGAAEVGTAQVGAIRHTGVQDGPVIDEATFVYEKASQAFDALAELIGFYWNIGYDKTLTFAPPEQVQAPFDIIEGSDAPDADQRSNFRDLVVEESREQYRNRQYLRAGTGETDSRTESFKGDGATKTFLLAFPAHTEPVVTVNGVAKTVGIQGVETGKDWYWNKGESELTQADGAAALLSTDTLAATYTGEYPLIVVSSNDDAIADRAAIEGGSGVYEEIIDDESLDTVDLANEKAAALLRRYGRIAERIDFQTDETGLRAGQLVRIWSPDNGVDGDYFIESIDASDVGAADGRIRHDVTAILGERLDNWIDFFRRLTDSGRRFILRENETLAVGRGVGEAVSLTDALVLEQAGATSAVVGAAIVGFSEIGDVATVVTGSVVGTGVVGTALVGSG
ncbi:MAG TPA: hypothetical protein VF156_15430 [Agromyces sp.]